MRWAGARPAGVAAETRLRPPENRSSIRFLGYVTPLPPPANFAGDWRMLHHRHRAPHDPRWAHLPEENGVWVVMMAGPTKDYPPTDRQALTPLRSLGPGITRRCGPPGRSARRRSAIAAPTVAGVTTKLDRWPERYVVLGDAFCGFNPIYGQGMTVAALSAVALGRRSHAGGQLDGVAARAERAFGKGDRGCVAAGHGRRPGWPETVGGEQQRPGGPLPGAGTSTSCSTPWAATSRCAWLSARSTSL